MADNDKPFIEPNSGRFSQPGGAATYAYEKPVGDLPDLSEAVKSQVQDDPEGLDAIDPDKATVPEELTKQLKEEREKAEEGTTARTGEVKDGTGATVVSEEQAKQSGVSPTDGGDKPVEPEAKGSGDDPSQAGEPRVVPVPKGEAPGEGETKPRATRARATSQVKDV